MVTLNYKICLNNHLPALVSKCTHSYKTHKQNVPKWDLILCNRICGCLTEFDTHERLLPGDSWWSDKSGHAWQDVLMDRPLGYVRQVVSVIWQMVCRNNLVLHGGRIWATGTGSLVHEIWLASLTGRQGSQKLLTKPKRCTQWTTHWVPWFHLS